MADLEGEIEGRYTSDNWGTFSFPFETLIPEGDAIDTVNVRAFLGNVTKKSTLDSFTEITDDLIDEDFAPQISADTTVLVKFKYPGATHKNTKATLIFELALESGAEHPFYFQWIKIY